MGKILMEWKKVTKTEPKEEQRVIFTYWSIAQATGGYRRKSKDKNNYNEWEFFLNGKYCDGTPPLYYLEVPEINEYDLQEEQYE